MELKWKFIQAEYYNSKGDISRTKECKRILSMELNNQWPIKMYLSGNTVYVAMADKQGVVRGVVIYLTISTVELHPKKCQIGYCIIKESEGPDRVKCPDEFLNLLSGTEDEASLEWRTACREWNKNKKDALMLENLPVGTRILAKWNESEVELRRTLMRQYKKPIWYDGYYKYDPYRIVVNGFTILS